MEIPTNSVSYHRYRPTTVLKITGDDAFLFLQGQFTQDLQPCAKGDSFAYGLWLNQKGKVLGDSFVLRQGTDWLCISLFSSAATLQARLEAYIIADDVTVEDVTSQWAGVAMFGRGAAELLAAKTGVLLPELGIVAEAKRGFVFQGRRLAERSWEWLYPISGDDESLELLALGASEIDSEAMERLRIEAGIPAVPRDLGCDDLPNEGGLDRDAISYTKGCYLGQEVMARLKTMGQVRRRLLRVTVLASVLPALPAPLFVDGKKIGELRSAVRTERGFVGLAMISLLGITEKRLLNFSPDSPADIVITDAPA